MRAHDTNQAGADGIAELPAGARARRVALTAMAASAIEWYDFSIYGTAAALVLGPAFFPGGSATTGILAGFATFTVGFVARPIGGIIFGHFGDRIGRKPVLVAALLLMAASTTLVGVLPTYASIGVVAPMLLVVLRVLQGLAVGGQWGGAMLLAYEHAPPHRRGLFSSLVQLGVPIGVVGGNAVFLLAGALLTPEQFLTWGWRVPFLISVVLVGVAMYVHRRIEDTPEFKAVERRLESSGGNRSRSPVIEALVRHPRHVLLAAGAFLVGNASFYILITGMLDYGTRVLHVPRTGMLMVVLLATLAMAVLTPIFALLSDRVGRRTVYGGGAAVLGLWAFVLFPLVDTGQLELIFVGLVVAMAALGAMNGPLAAMFAEMFPAHVRYSGASLGYQIASVAGGGLAPFIMVLLLNTTGTSVSVSIYIALLAVVALVCLVFARTSEEKAAPS